MSKITSCLYEVSHFSYLYGLNISLNKILILYLILSELFRNFGYFWYYFYYTQSGIQLRSKTQTSNLGLYKRTEQYEMFLIASQSMLFNEHERCFHHLSIVIRAPEQVIMRRNIFQ